MLSAVYLPGDPVENEDGDDDSRDVFIVDDDRHGGMFCGWICRSHDDDDYYEDSEDPKGFRVIHCNQFYFAHLDKERSRRVFMRTMAVRKKNIVSKLFIPMGLVFFRICWISNF